MDKNHLRILLDIDAGVFTIKNYSFPDLNLKNEFDFLISQGYIIADRFILSDKGNNLLSKLTEISNIINNN